MRKASTLIIAAAVALALAHSGFAQTATTDPVGFITVPIAAGSFAAPKITFVSPTLTRAISWQGLITAISPNSVSVAGAPWTLDQFNGSNGAYFVEVFSASKAGALSDITATTTNSITTVDNLASYAAVGDSIRIRKHVTIADFLGASNTYGLLASDDPSTSDEVVIYDGSSSLSYFYYTGSPGFPAGWYNSTAFTPAGNAVIAPDVGMFIKRKAAGVVNIVSVGTVKTGDTLVSVRPAINVLGTVSAQGLTLATSGLYRTDHTGITGSDDPSSGDEVTIYSATGSKNYFYYTGSPGFPAGWYDSTAFVASDTVPIAAGSSFVLNRKVGGLFNWVLPSPTTF